MVAQLLVAAWTGKLGFRAYRHSGFAINAQLVFGKLRLGWFRFGDIHAEKLLKDIV